jgi:(heptosyl)LPS beta-1,4-glucosyltransferase
MRLGGFVIHGNSRATLGRCLDSLAAVADVCVAVDCGSTDGSSELARGSGFRRIVRHWEGYGAARAAAAEELADCQYVFFLDSDEWLEPDAIAALRAWKGSGASAPHYSLERRDWADLHGRRFLYRTEHHIRLIRWDAATWRRDMIVHEALPPATTVRLPVTIDHEFADSVEGMRVKAEQYALLWAIRNWREARRIKPALLQRLAHLFREALLKGAAFRGGMAALQLARVVASHHARKYVLLREIRRGAYPDLVRAFEEDRLADLFRILAGAMPARAPVRSLTPAPRAMPPVRPVSASHRLAASAGMSPPE